MLCSKTPLSVLLSLFLLAALLPGAAHSVPFVETHAGQAFLPRVEAQVALDEQLASWQAFDLSLDAVERQVRSDGRLALVLGGQQFDLELEPVDLLRAGFRAVEVVEGGRELEVAPPTGTYRGTLVGKPDSEVRLLVLPDLLQGFVKTDDEWFFIDPLVKFDPEAPSNQVVLFREDDVHAGARGLCGSAALDATHALEVATEEMRAGSSAHLVTTAFEADIALEADFEYQQRFGSQTISQMAGIINQVLGLTSPELGVGFGITFMRSWTISNDPYSSNDSQTLLFQFRDEWNSNPPAFSHDVAHLFTGRNLAGSVIGRAFLRVICASPSSSYGLSQNHALMVQLVAHELGHNLGASHDDQVQPPASSCNGTGTIMCSQIQGGHLSRYSDRSKSDVTQFIDGNSCMVPTPPWRPLSISITSERCRGLHTVSWRATGGTTRYELERSTSSSFSNTTRVYSGPRTDYFGSQAGYYYQVRSCNALGCGAFRRSSTKSTYHSGCQ